MDPKFILLQTVDYTIFEKNFLQVSRPDGFSLAPKSYSRILPRILAKVISWWRFPDLRVAAVRNAFSKCIETTTSRVVGELSNLYIHAQNFNQRVIEKHNKTWVFWARVPLLNLTALEDRIRTGLQTTLASLQRKGDTKSLKAAVEALESVADPSLLPVELRLLHARLDTACQIFSQEHAEEKQNQLEELRKLDSWTCQHIEKLTNTIQPTVTLFVQEGVRAPASEVKFHTDTWQALQTKLANLLADSSIKRKMSEAALRELEQMKERVTELLKRVGEGRNMADLSAEITAMPSLPTQLDQLGRFLPVGPEVDAKIQTVKNSFDFIRKVASLYPAHAARLEEYKASAPKEIERREQAFEKYGDIGSQALNLRTTELVELLRKTYPQDNHPVVTVFLNEARELYSVQSICKNAKKLLALRQVPAREEEAANKLEDVEAVLSEVYSESNSKIPNLYKKWKALKEEVEALWEPVRKRQQDKPSND